MKPEENASESTGPDSGISDLGKAPWADLTPAHKEVVCAAASPEFLRWTRETFPDLSYQDRREIILGAVRAVQVIRNDGKARTKKTLLEALQWQCGYIEAEQRYGLIQPGDKKQQDAGWKHFFEASHWRWVADRFFRNRDLFRDLGDVTNDPRFQTACTDVWLKHKQAKSACHPPALLDKLLRVYGTHKRIEDLDRGRRVVDLRTEQLESDVAASKDSPEMCCADESAYPDAARFATAAEEEPAQSDEIASENLGRTPYADVSQLIDACIGKLTPNQAEVLRATIDGLSSKQVATSTSKSISTIDNTRRQARERLIGLLVQTMGFDRLWDDLPVHWKTPKVREKLLLAGAVRRRRTRHPKPNG